MVVIAADHVRTLGPAGVERLMRQAGVAGVYRRRGHGCTRRDPFAEPADDLVNRAFDRDRPCIVRGVLAYADGGHSGRLPQSHYP